MDVEHSQQIEELYLEMFDKLMAYARASLMSDSLAEEAVQETFRIACQKPDALCSSPNPQGWLVIVLKNTIMNMRSSRTASQKIIEKYIMNQAGEIVCSENRISLNILYENISDSEEFKLLSEMAIEGKSHEEMARSRGISVNACKKRVQRAKEVLQRRIKK